jgi:hypothetical protein
MSAIYPFEFQHLHVVVRQVLNLVEVGMLSKSTEVKVFTVLWFES